MTENGQKRLFSHTNSVASIVDALRDAETGWQTTLITESKKLKVSEEEKLTCQKALGEERARCAALQKTMGEERMKNETALGEERARCAALQKTMGEERTKQHNIKVLLSKHETALGEERARCAALQKTMEEERARHETALKEEKVRHVLVLDAYQKAALEKEDTLTSKFKKQVSDLADSVQEKQDEADTWRNATELDKILSKQKEEESKKLMKTAADTIQAIESKTKVLQAACKAWIKGTATI